MTRQRHTLHDERGFALFYMAVFLTMLLIFVGLAVDTGRAYVVQAQLSKAVDGAALGAARMLNSGNPSQEAANIYNANFPDGWMGTSSSTRPGQSGFFTMTTDPVTGVNVVNVRATAVVPTTFMKLANFQELRVNALGEATRRMVDLSLVMDVSGSIGWRWPYVRRGADVRRRLRRPE
jgi:Flp pilus assembly protein TadG